MLKIKFELLLTNKLRIMRKNLLIIFMMMLCSNLIGQISVSPTEIDFGDVAANKSLSKTFTVKNTYTEDLNIDFEEWSSYVNGFDVSSITPNGTLTLASGASRTYTITIVSPNNFDLFLGYLGLTYNNNNIGGTHSILLSLNVIAPPSTPSNLNASATANSCALTWNAPSGGADSYNIFKGNNETVIATTASPFYTVSNLTPSTEYTFYVQAENIGGVSGKTSVNVRTKPSAPSGLSYSNATTSSCNLSWTSTGAARYYVYDNNDNSLVTSTTSTSITINNLCSETQYEFYVKAYDNVNYSDKSNVVKPITLAYSVTGPETICASDSPFSVSNLSPGATVTWTQSINIDYVSGQGTNNYVVKALDSGPHSTGGIGSVKATINTPGCSTLQKTKEVWVGRPRLYRYDENGNEIFSGQVLTVNTGTVVTFEAYSYNDPDAVINWEVLPSTAYYVENGPECTVMASASFITATAKTTNECGEYWLLNTLRGTSGDDPFGGNPLSLQSKSPKPENNAGNLIELEITNFNVYPNPASNKLEIELPNNSDNENSAFISIYNTASVQIYSNKVDGDKITVDVSNFKNGLYVIQILKGTEKYSRQIVIEH